MAATGIILRRNPTKGFFTGDNALIEGELVVETTTNSFGYIDEGDTLVWGKIENELPAGGDTGQILSKLTDDDFIVEWTDAPTPKSVVQGQVHPEIDGEYCAKIPWDFSTQKVLAGEIRFPLQNDWAFGSNGEVTYGVNFNVSITTDFWEFDDNHYADYISMRIPLVMNNASFNTTSGEFYTKQVEVNVYKVGNFLYIQPQEMNTQYGDYFKPPFELYYSADETTFTGNVWTDYYRRNPYYSET